MANVNSDQIAKIIGNPQQQVKSNEFGGRLRRAFFSSAVLPTGLGDTVTLCRIPAGARVLGGSFAVSVAQGVTATMAIGVAGTAGKYRTAAITNALTPFAIAGSVAENLGAETTAEETIIATNAAAAWVTAVLKGYIEYIVD